MFMFLISTYLLIFISAFGMLPEVNFEKIKEDFQEDLGAFFRKSKSLSSDI